MSKLFSAVALFNAMLLIAGCRVVSLEPEFPEESGSSVQFTLTATYGGRDSKVSIDGDGLNMSWTPGDVLYLVDPAGTNATVTLNTDITKESKTAAFYTKEVVRAGEYIVVYGQDNLDVVTDISLKSVSELSGLVRLYGSLTVEPDQTKAEITLKQLFTMLTFKFKNLPADGEITTMGMAVASEGLESLDKGEITADGLETGFSGDYLTYFNWNSGKDSKSLIAPVDLSGKKVFFFVWGRNAEGRHINYEFAKEGINLQEGNNYNVTLDFSTAAVSTIYKTAASANILTSAADFRAAAYWNSGLTFWLEEDIDFKDEVVFPIRAAGLWGNGHTLSNIKIDLAQCRKVGILSEGHGHDLNVVSSSFTGNEMVGGICGQGYCENCICSSVTVNGGQDIGGLVGRVNYHIRNCSILGQSRVSGSRNYVGGIAGYCSFKIDSCLVKGNVLIKSEGQYTGGIAGIASEGVTVCGVEATVEGTRYYTGGVVGWGSCYRSYCYGDVTGTDNVGGVAGNLGESGHCTDCYHIGSVTGDNGAPSVGGISGLATDGEIIRCYSCGNVSSGYGICYEMNEAYAAFNLTSEERLSKDAAPADYCNCGPGNTFLSKLSVLQGSDNNYVEACWPGLNIGGGDPRCPLLAWQYEFGDSIDIPGFIDVTW